MREPAPEWAAQVLEQAIGRMRETAIPVCSCEQHRVQLLTPVRFSEHAKIDFSHHVPRRIGEVACPQIAR